MGQGHLARGIDAVSAALAGALLSLLTWWIDHGMPGSPAEMDDLYHGMVWSGVAARPGPPIGR